MQSKLSSHPLKDASEMCSMLLAVAQICLLFFVAGKNGLASDFAYRGNVSFQAQHFTKNSTQSIPSVSPLSFSSAVEVSRGIDESNIEFIIAPFFRWDSEDEDRSHFDVRELKVTNYSGNWELQLGMAQVFWGVAEARNIVDIINQADGLEGATSSEKLGQPMIHFTHLWDDDAIELLIMPYFRQRSFGGSQSRPRSDFLIDTDTSTFESGAAERNMDIALRYSTTYNEWDLGFSLFHGTRREPELVFNESLEQLTPFYPLITHAAVDVQATIESWLLKTELVYQSGAKFTDHTKLVAGFEYTFYDIKSSGVDVGLVSEYLYDGLGETAFNIFDNDLLVGVRLALNDVQSTAATFAYSLDFDTSDQFFTAEFSRRVGSSFKLSVEATTLANENYFAVNFQRFF